MENNDMPDTRPADKEDINLLRREIIEFSKSHGNRLEKISDRVTEHSISIGEQNKEIENLEDRIAMISKLLFVLGLSLFGTVSKFIFDLVR